MKLGIFSDIHIDFGFWDFVEDPEIVYINAGDIAHNHMLRNHFIEAHPNVLTVWGNHDYYGAYGVPWNQAKDHKWEREIDGLKIRGATLWTDMKNDYDFYQYVHALVDASYIPSDFKSYKEVHESHKEWLFDSDADVLVMHHAPSYKSVTPRFHGSPDNKFFMTELSHRILDMPKSPKLVIHGHVHSSHDYMIGNSRVICHPRGYPNETKHYGNYEPLIVEI